MTRPHLWRLAWIILGATVLPGCDQISERAGFPDPAKVEAEGKAIGGACRHAGRGLEDCYRLNEGAAKATVYAGWKDMNEYMVKNNMQAVEPTIPSESSLETKKHNKADDAAEGGDKEADKPKKQAKGEAKGNDAGKGAAKEH